MTVPSICRVCEKKPVAKGATTLCKKCALMEASKIEKLHEGRHDFVDIMGEKVCRICGALKK